MFKQVRDIFFHLLSLKCFTILTLLCLTHSIRCDESYYNMQEELDGIGQFDSEEEFVNKRISSDGFYDVFKLMDEELITIASKIEEKIKKAPSIITIITDKEIENMGVRTLYDIMRIVPGFDLHRRPDFGGLIYGVRGIKNADDKVKIFLNGHSLNVGRSGRTAFFFDDLPLKNVKRIEIIRGPGSALYGTNAFLAVINVITKGVDDIEHFEISSGFGSFDTQEYNIMFGKTIHDIDIDGFATFYNTNGPHEKIKEDAAFLEPELFGSRAPGKTDESRNKLDLNLNITYKDIKFHTKYFNKDTEPYTGSRFILTDDGENRYSYLLLDLSYEFELWNRLTVKPRIYYDQYEFEWFHEAFGDGFTPDLDEDGVGDDLDGDGDIEVFPDGVRSKNYGRNKVAGAEIHVDYDLFENNRFSFGFGFEWNKQDNIDLSTNFMVLPGEDPSFGSFIGAVQDQGDVLWIKEYIRQIWHIYIQDKWDITDKLSFTLGIRHDQYNDFDGTTNPRIGIVWDFMDNATLKILYGQAFRAPSFRELTLDARPVRIGNKGLEPEKIRTYEVGLSCKFNENISTNVNYFFNLIRDPIGVIEADNDDPESVRQFENLDGANIQGIEFEAKANLSDYWLDAYAFANYTYQDAESKGDPLPDVPKHKGNVGINLGITKYLNANLHAFISGERIRAQEDTRDDSPGFALLNLTLIGKEFFNDLKIKASIFNLLDKDWDDPAQFGRIATDLPRPGRNFFVEFSYEF